MIKLEIIDNSSFTKIKNKTKALKIIVGFFICSDTVFTRFSIKPFFFA